MRSVIWASGSSWTLCSTSVDPRRLAEQGVEFVKVQMALLTSALDGSVATEIHPHDFSGLFARHGITLVVSEVDAERVALELQDYSATLAQGAAFGEPRPVRLDVIEAAAQVAAVAAAAGSGTARARSPRRAGPALLRPLPVSTCGAAALDFTGRGR